jgi:hypothetical protein
MKLIKFLCMALLLTLYSCPDDDTMNDIEEIAVVEVNVLEFNYIPQTETTPERLVYNIELINSSNVDAQGGLRLTYKSDELEVSTLATNQSQCYQIPANTTCLYSFDETGTLDLLAPSSITFVSAAYTFF